jgi:hypothetical protein
METNSSTIHRTLQFAWDDGSIAIYEFDFEIQKGPVIEPTISPEVK